jgi:hypothetical protein
MGYCTVDDVKRLLRILDSSTNNQYKVRLSDSHTVPESFDTNQGTGTFLGVTQIRDDYAGSEMWHVKFSDGSRFLLYRGDGQLSCDGTGNIYHDFTSLSTNIIIFKDRWAGTFLADDRFKFRTDSNISIDDTIEFIDDSEVIIDNMLNKFIENTDPMEPMFTEENAPRAIRKASAYITANLVFTSAFSTVSTENVPTLVRRWYNLGNNLVEQFLQTIYGKGLQKFIGYPRFVSRQPLFTKVGIQETAGIDSSPGEVEAQNVEYDRDFNTKESVGAD